VFSFPYELIGLVLALQAAPDVVFSTAATSLKPNDVSDPNRVKCMVDTHEYAIYFSRGSYIDAIQNRTCNCLVIHVFLYVQNTGQGILFVFSWFCVEIWC
jgi:CMP-2-keto-3-deoxyoctulosonic acid synthetase